MSTNAYLFESKTQVLATFLRHTAWSLDVYMYRAPMLMCRKLIMAFGWDILNLIWYWLVLLRSSELTGMKAPITEKPWTSLKNPELFLIEGQIPIWWVLTLQKNTSKMLISCPILKILHRADKDTKQNTQLYCSFLGYKYPEFRVYRRTFIPVNTWIYNWRQFQKIQEPRWQIRWIVSRNLYS